MDDACSGPCSLPNLSQQRREGERERDPGLRFPGAEPVLGPQQIFCPTRVGWLCTMQILPLFKPRSAITERAMMLIAGTTARVGRDIILQRGAM